ncbi:MAG: BON domain-containing protein [Acidobacteria bacterium]|nr:BON domain-containing protein [Acidobacteriota bacterium]
MSEAATTQTEQTPTEKTDTGVVPLSAIRQQRIPEETSEFSTPRDMVFLSPNETKRRFPLFTSAQITLMVIGAALIIMMAVIAFLLWRQQKKESAAQPPNQAMVLPSPAAGASPSASPSPSPSDDAAIIEAVKSSLLAYNPLGFSHYKYEVKDGVVTLTGEADHQPEKEGAENVIRLINGVRDVVNNLKVKPEQIAAPAKLNAAEAKFLDDALNRQSSDDERTGNEKPRASQPDPQKEAERVRRETMATRQREEEATVRKAAEEKLRREAEEYEKRQEEIRRAEAERRARAEKARIETGVLNSGTVAWSGTVDGVDEIIFSGSSSSVRHISGPPTREVKASFSAPIPRSPVVVRLLSSSGRGSIQIIQQPASSNGYTTIVRIDDTSKSGEKRYEFTLKWMVQ